MWDFPSLIHSVILRKTSSLFYSRGIVTDPNDYNPTDTGDGGVDVVRWLPLGDSQPSNMIVLGQCACTPDWVRKQSSSSYDAWHSRINFIARPSNMCFIPFFFRNAGGAWYKAKDIHSSVLVDRLRLMTLLPPRIESSIDIFESHPAHNIVEEVLEEQSSVF